MTSVVVTMVLSRTVLEILQVLSSWVTPPLFYPNLGGSHCNRSPMLGSARAEP